MMELLLIFFIIGSFFIIFLSKIEYYLLILLILLFPLGQIVRIPVKLEGSVVSVMPSDIIITALLTFWIIRKTLTGFRIKKTLINNLIISFSLISAFSLIIAAFRMEIPKILVSSLYTIRWVMFASLYFVIIDILKKIEEIKFLLKLFYLMGIAIGILGAVQYLFFNNFIILSQVIAGGGWDPHTDRMISTFLDPNFLGGYFMFLSAITFSIFTRKKEYKITQILLNPYFIGFIFFSACLLLTLSRASLLSYLIVIGIIILSGIKKRKYFMIFLCISAMLIFTTPSLIKKHTTADQISIENPLHENIQIDSSAYTRISSWENAWGIISKNVSNFVFGIGNNTYAFERGSSIKQGTTGAVNSFLFIWLTTGLIGLIIYIALLSRIYKSCSSIMKNPIHSPNLKSYAYGYKMGLVGLVIHSQFIDTLTYPQIMETMWIFFGLIYAYKIFEARRFKLNEF